ncbi:LuxR C-terminal-related transcriptional regulator [Vogesella fluminis]|uniref:Helix-turn-helix transcriptional regulator n=1 Tax=Vogesella fluminis TaxID=1069161 RepID=A0ABQ3HCV8_9NEIS|nr:response regulator transcription factor [Vogesella fluminis]GHD79298.1 helix-turn-helix transcriptional regulator [Vogesella fluminis]
MPTLLITSSPSLQQHLQAALDRELEVYDSLSALAEQPQRGVQGVVWVDVDNQDEALLARLCRGDFGRARVIVLSSTPSDRQAVQWLGAGAAGFLHAFSQPATLRQADAVVAADGIWIGIGLMQQLCARFGQVARTDSPLLAQLTERERDVVGHLREGKSNKQIARDMDISERTVKAHLTAIFGKLGVPDRVQLLLKLSG